jgi:Flp pilus assembly protein TadD
MTANELCAAARQRHLAGDLAGAVELIEQAVALKPRNALFRETLGLALRQAGRNAEAIAAFRQAVRLGKSSVSALCNLGSALAAGGEPAEAAACFRRAIAINPKFAGAHNGLGNALAALGDPGRAAKAFRQALDLDPNAAQLHINLATMLLQLGRDAEAADLLEKALAIVPTQFQAMQLLSQACQRTGDEAVHERALRRALECAPDNVAFVAELGLLLHRLDREPEAGPYFKRALELAPDDPVSHANYGIWLRTTGDLAGAAARLRAGLSLTPGNQFLHHALSHTLLSMGQMREGFAESEWRDIPARYTAPAWTGEAEPGRTLLIMIEQGRGDVIQFLRYVPLAAKRMRVVLETASSLRRLAASVDGVAALFYPGETVPEHDVFCPLLSLPRVLGLDDAPLGMDAENPYLRADPDDIARWAERVAALRGRRIGITWAGATVFSMDRRRSIPPALFDGLARDDVSFVSLQVDPVAKPGMKLVDWTGELRDFADTAALIETLDLVISVDTAVAHLAGALGKPVWLLNRFDSDWRWLREGEGSAWYPTLRQFRQQELGDWGSVMAAVRLALETSGNRHEA